MAFGGAEAAEADEGVSLRSSLTVPPATWMDQEAATDEAPQCRWREQQQRDEAAVMAPPWRRGRCLVDADEAPSTTTAAAAAGRRCRSCAAVAIADCVALGCCPCAVVSLLGLAFVKAPLVVGRRCVGRLRRRRRLLLHNKRVRDASAEDKAGKADKGGEGIAAAVATSPPSTTGSPSATMTTEAELAWLEEMYRVGHWGFGRVSVSGESPVKS